MQNGITVSTSTIKGYTGPVDKIPFDKQISYQALHYQLVAAAKLANYIHDTYSDIKIGCMNLFITKYPLTCNPDDILESQKQNRIVISITSCCSCKNDCICSKRSISFHSKCSRCIWRRISKI